MTYILAIGCVVIGSLAYLGIQATNEVIHFYNHPQKEKERDDNQVQ